MANTLASTKKQPWIDKNYPVVQGGGLKVGDVVAFGSSDPRGHGHVAIYVGDGMIIEAKPEGGVRVSAIRQRADWQNMTVRRYHP